MSKPRLPRGIRAGTRTASFVARRRDKPERRIMQRAVAELRVAFTRRGHAKPFPFFHCPNEGELVGGEREAQQRHADGVESGVPDLVVLARNGSGCPTAIELKAPGGKPTPAQHAMLQHFAAIGFACRVFAGHSETANGLCELGYISPEQRDAWIAWAERADPGAL